MPSPSSPAPQAGPRRRRETDIAVTAAAATSDRDVASSPPCVGAGARSAAGEESVAAAAAAASEAAVAAAVATLRREESARARRPPEAPSSIPGVPAAAVSAPAAAVPAPALAETAGKTGYAKGRTKPKTATSSRKGRETAQARQHPPEAPSLTATAATAPAAPSPDPAPPPSAEKSGAVKAKAKAKATTTTPEPKIPRKRRRSSGGVGVGVGEDVPARRQSSLLGSKTKRRGGTTPRSPRPGDRASGDGKNRVRPTPKTTTTLSSSDGRIVDEALDRAFGGVAAARTAAGTRAGAVAVAVAVPPPAPASSAATETGDGGSSTAGGGKGDPAAPSSSSSSSAAEVATIGGGLFGARIPRNRKRPRERQRQEGPHGSAAGPSSSSSSGNATEARPRATAIASRGPENGDRDDPPRSASRDVDDQAVLFVRTYLLEAMGLEEDRGGDGRGGEGNAPAMPADASSSSSSSLASYVFLRGRRPAHEPSVVRELMRNYLEQSARGGAKGGGGGGHSDSGEDDRREERAVRSIACACVQSAHVAKAVGFARAARRGRDDDDMTKKERKRRESLMRGARRALMTLLSIVRGFLCDLGYPSELLRRVAFPASDGGGGGDDGTEEEAAGAARMGRMRLVVRNVFEPCLWYVVPLLTHWPFPPAIDPDEAGGEEEEEGDDDLAAAIGSRNSLGGKHATALLKVLWSLADARWEKPGGNSRGGGGGVGAAPATILRPRVMHVFLTQLASQESWPLDKVGLELRGNRITSTFWRGGCQDDAGDEGDGGGDDGELWGDEDAEGLARRWVDWMVGSDREVGAGAVAGAGDASRDEAGANGAPTTSRDPKSALKEWYDQNHDGTEINYREAFQAWHDGALSHEKMWTCEFACPITGKSFPCGRWPSSFSCGGGGDGDRPENDGRVWFPTKKMAEKAAAAAALESMRDLVYTAASPSSLREQRQHLAAPPPDDPAVMNGNHRGEVNGGAPSELLHRTIHALQHDSCFEPQPPPQPPPLHQDQTCFPPQGNRGDAEEWSSSPLRGGERHGDGGFDNSPVASHPSHDHYYVSPEEVDRTLLHMRIEGCMYLADLLRQLPLLNHLAPVISRGGRDDDGRHRPTPPPPSPAGTCRGEGHERVHLTCYYLLHLAIQYMPCGGTAPDVRGHLVAIVSSCLLLGSKLEDAPIRMSKLRSMVGEMKWIPTGCEWVLRVWNQKDYSSPNKKVQQEKTSESNVTNQSEDGNQLHAKPAMATSTDGKKVTAPAFVDSTFIMEVPTNANGKCPFTATLKSKLIEIDDDANSSGHDRHARLERLRETKREDHRRKEEARKRQRQRREEEEEAEQRKKKAYKMHPNGNTAANPFVALVQRYEVHIISLLWRCDWPDDDDDDDDDEKSTTQSSWDVCHGSGRLLPVHPTSYLTELERRLRNAPDCSSISSRSIRRAIHDMWYTHSPLALLQQPRLALWSLLHLRKSWASAKAADDSLVPLVCRDKVEMVVEHISQVKNCVAMCRVELKQEENDGTQQAHPNVEMAEVTVRSFSVSDDACAHYPNLNNLVEKLNDLSEDCDGESCPLDVHEGESPLLTNHTEGANIGSGSDMSCSGSGSNGSDMSCSDSEEN